MGGVLVAATGWRSIFWLNVPICAAMIAATIRYVPDSRAPRPRRVDVPGQLLMIAALGSLTYAVIQGPVAAASTAVPVLALFAVAALAAAAFIAVERRVAEPLVELRFIRSRPFTGAWRERGPVVHRARRLPVRLHHLPAGGTRRLAADGFYLSLLPATLVMAAAAPVAGQLTARRGPRVPLVASGLCIAAGLALLLGLGPGTSYWWLAVAIAVLGAGLGLVNPPITNTGVSGMPPAQAGVASAVISVTRQVGSLLGVAVMGDMVTSGVRSGMAAGQPRAAALSAATHAPWVLGIACGLLVALAGYLSTTARAHATAADVAAAG